MGLPLDSTFLEVLSKHDYNPIITKLLAKEQVGGAISSSVHLNDSILEKWIAARGIPGSKRAALAKAINRLVDMELLPKWDDRDRYDHLRPLTAPQFLKMVHAGSIKNNVVIKQDIRDIDDSLMSAVEAYISNRRRRNLDLGDAKGLKFVLKHLARNVAPRRAPRAAAKLAR